MALGDVGPDARTAVPALVDLLGSKDNDQKRRVIARWDDRADRRRPSPR